MIVCLEKDDVFDSSRITCGIHVDSFKTSVKEFKDVSIPSEIWGLRRWVMMMPCVNAEMHFMAGVDFY